ncbi:Nudix family hydrolase [Lysobacter sp. 2RAF19]
MGGPVEVVAGVIRDKAGRILLARRTEGRDLAGLWEFPGGKREPGESPEAALARELHEELGIDITCGEPVIAVPQRYPHKRLRLDVRLVASWRGTVKGHEGQALAWAPPHTLGAYAMPSADIPVVAALLQPDRYLVTPAPNGSDAAWLEALEAALAAGIRRVQLRAPHCPPTRWASLVEAAVDACRRHGADVLVNGDIALAQAMDIGVHLRSTQLAALDARPLPKEQRVGASCHTLEDLRRAEAIGCDFAVLGPIAATPTHPEAVPLGWDGFAAMREEVALPIYAIGGMRFEDIPVARAHGAQGIAAIRGLWVSG